MDNPNGECSVKLRYRKLCFWRVNVGTLANNIIILKKLWHLAIPRKILLFGWRVINGILTTRTTLSRRRINVELVCPLCEIEEETEFHSLCTCSFVSAAWIALRWGFKEIQNHSSSTVEWILLLIDKMEKTKIEDIICIF